MRRNVSGQFVGAQMISATDGSAFTGSVTVAVTGDAGTQATGSVGSGACTHEGNGFHTYAPAQAETNYTHVAYTFTGTGAIPVTVQIYPVSYDASGRFDVGSFGGTAGTFSGGRPEVNTTHWGGTAVASAVVSANAIQISGDSVAADNAESFFDGTGYAGTNNVIPTVTTATNVTTVNGLAANVITAASIAADAGAEIADAVWDEALAGHAAAGSAGKALSAAGTAADPWLTALPGAYGAGTAGSLIGRIPDIAAGSAGGLFIAGSNAATTVAITGNITGNLSGSVGSVTGAVGSVTGNVGGNVTGSVGSVVGAVGSVTGNVGGNVVGSVGSLTTNNDKTGYALSATGSAAMTEGYAALGAAGTLPQILYEIRALLAEKSISTTTVTTKKLDGSTTAATYTLDNATTPSSITRAT